MINKIYTYLFYDFWNNHYNGIILEYYTYLLCFIGTV